MEIPTSRLLVVRTSNLQNGSEPQSETMSSTRGSAGSSEGENTGRKEALCFSP